MQIISATNDDGDRLTAAEINNDMPQLEAAHAQAMKDEPTWAFFGGVLTIGTHQYQVA